MSVNIFATHESPQGDRVMSRLLAESWWALAIRGAAAIILGIIAIFLPGAAMLTLAMFFSAWLLVDGVFGIISAIRAARSARHWGLLLAEGILDVAVGIVVFLFPAGAVIAFVIITAAWALLSGVLRLGAAFKLTRDHGRGWLTLSAIASILFGIALVISPLVGAVVLTWWLGAYAIVFGISMLALAFRLHDCNKRENVSSRST